MLIRNKLILWFSAIVAFILLIFSVFVYLFYANYREELFFDRIKTKAIFNATLFTKRQAHDSTGLKYLSGKDLTNLVGEQVSVLDFDNFLLYSNNPKPIFEPSTDLLNEIKQSKLVKKQIGNRQLFGMTFQTPQEEYIIFASAIDEYGMGTLVKLSYILIIANFISLIIILISGWIFANAALRPISLVIKEVGKISGNNLNLRLNEGNKVDEIAKLAVTFNEMLSRLQISYDSKKSFISNASHELRTPLAILLSELETSYKYDKNIEAYRETIFSAIEEIKKLVKLTNGLLNLTKIDEDPEAIFKDEICLHEILNEIIAEVTKRYANQPIELELKEKNTYYKENIVLGNVELLKIAISNIVDNACKYSNGKKVSITLVADQHKTYQIFISDQGIGIHPKDLNYIKEPLFRGSNTKEISGFGIGLSLADKIINLNKGKLLFIPNNTKGITVVIKVPIFINKKQKSIF